MFPTLIRQPVNTLSPVREDLENPYEFQAQSQTQDSLPKQADEEEYEKELEKSGDRAREMTAE